jgi:ATP-dependent DNA ligase
LKDKYEGTYLQVAPHEVCEGMDHMHQYLQDIIDIGGGGIILRDPLAPYQPGRSLAFLKYKVIAYCSSCQPNCN